MGASGDSDLDTALEAETRALGTPGSSTEIDVPVSSEKALDVRLDAGELVAGRYRVEGLLGEGGFAEVYRVRDETQGGPALALKLHRLRRPDMLTAIQAEFSLLASLTHPNLAAVTDFGQVGDHLAFFTQEIAPGVPLWHARLSVTEPRTVRLFAQLCRALDYLHGRGVLHRDVKGSNLLVDLENEHLTLLDFGIARAFGSGNDTVAGTMGYIAPETFGGGSVDGRVDLYALGVVLYRMITGRRPFSGSQEQIVWEQCFGEPRVVPTDATTPPLARLVERLLSREPSKRHASAGELLEDLTRATGVDVPVETSETLASYVLSAPTVGDPRTAEVLREATAPDAAGRVTILVGEAGAGKSRRLADRRVEVLLDRRRWFGARASRTDDGRSSMHELARTLVTPSMAHHLTEDERIELARAMPSLRRDGEQIAVAVDPERARAARLAVLARVIDARCLRGAGVVVFEDLHHADADVLAQLAELIEATRARGAQVAFVLTSRSTSALEAFEARVLPARRLEIGALDASQARALVAGVFGDAELVEGTPLGEALRTPKTALEVQETIRLALDRADLVRRDGRWERVRSLEAPPLEHVLSERVSLRTPSARRLLLAASVLGRPAPLATLAQISGASVAEVASSCGELVRSGIVEDHESGAGVATYAVHDRFADVVLEGASDTDRRTLHTAAAAHLERGAGDDWRQLGRAAEHRRLADDPVGAAASLEAAAEVAAASGRPDAACALVARQLELVPPTTDLWLRRADLAFRAGLGAETAECLEALRRALPGASPQEAQEISFRIARAAATSGDGAEAARRTEEGLRFATTEGAEDLELRWRLLGAQVESSYGKLGDARRAYVAAAELARRGGHREDEARGWLGASYAAYNQLQLDDTIELAMRAMKAAEGSEPALRTQALRILSNVYRARGDQLECMRLTREAVAVARACGSTLDEAKALNNLSVDESRVGDLRAALAASRRSIALKERGGAALSVEISRNNYGYLLSSLGREDEAREVFEGVLSRARNQAIQAFAYANLGELELRRCRFEEADRLFAESLAAARAHGYDATQSPALVGLIRTWVMRGEPSRAEPLLAELEALTAGVGHETGRRFTTTAVVRAVSGDPDAALDAARCATSNSSQVGYLLGTLGSRVEAQWVHALCAARAGREEEAREMCSCAQLTLTWLAEGLPTAEERRMFMENHPMRPAIMAGQLDLPPGWTWPQRA